ncbi:MAG: hypothetical protein ACREJV_07520, partial [Candidatus Rokuibacteriota bacterium]
TGLMLLIGAEVNAEIAKAAGERGATSTPEVSPCAECRRLAHELAQADHRRLPAVVTQLERHRQQEDTRRPAA